MTNFCTSGVKKFMMVKADRARGKGLFHMQKAWNKAVAIALLGTVACGQPSYAQNTENPVKFIKYEYYQDPSYDPAYTIAWDAMASIYKGSEFEKGKVDGANPFLEVGQIDLNGDRMDEIIAVPVPTEPESLPLCTEINQICPFYLLEVRDKTVHNLGIIKAAAIDRGDDVENGYWTLKVYQRTDSGDKYTGPFIYAYDRKKDGYFKKTSSSILPLPTSPAAKAP